ncbi:MAG: RNA 3'-terminal-phosphate cyclase [Gammaproteobacteria bacterium SG8_11]|nr:MAG: RNA 3'-terminal-phosphate cyclase [Gammaproteobacteria bacterium SG8_11]
MKEKLIHLDGSQGEGGGQILRTSLALSVCLQKPFKIEKIRANRRRPGLMRQHLTAVKAAARISNAHVEGDELSSQQLLFSPNEVQAGEYHFAIGTAGSATLVLQTILLPLLFAKGASKITIEGGTHNPLAPPFDFLQYAYIPLLEKMGAKIKATLVRPGFFPAGGGCIELEVEPVDKLKPISLAERGKIVETKAQVLISGLPFHIVERELKILKQKLNWPDNCYEIRDMNSAYGPGNVITVIVKSENVCEVFTGFGEKGVKAEAVADKVVKEVRRYITSDVPVEEHLSDQVLLPMALAGKGEYVTTTPSRHTLTNIDVIKHFIDITINIEEIENKQFLIKLSE